MNIGLDYRPALRPNSRRRGVGRYTHQLAQALLQLDTEHQLVLYGLSGHSVELSGSFRLQPVVHLPKPSRLHWLTDSLVLPRRIRADALDAFHVTDPLVVPAHCDCRLIVMVHDLIPYIYWEETKVRVPWDYRLALKRARRRVGDADVIVTPSEHSRDDVCRLLSVPASRVRVVPHGCTLEPRDADHHRRNDIRKRYALGSRFLLYVGGSDYRKNLGRMFKAYRQIRSRGYTGQLVMVGETFDWDIPEVLELKHIASHLDITEHVRYLGYVPDEDLSILYGMCDFFFFPSLYEGFGLPVLEAMQCGAPLLLSRTSSIPEVAGDTAFYFDPEHVEAIVECFAKAVSDPDMVERKRKAAELRARDFSWAAVARRMMELYEEGFRRRDEG